MVSDMKLWNVIKKEKIENRNIRLNFQKDNVFVYSEVQLKILNDFNLSHKIGINPFFHHSKKFQEHFKYCYKNRENKVIEELENIYLHYLGEIDLLRELSKKDFHEKVVLENLKKDKYISGRLGILDEEESQFIAYLYIKQKEVKESLMIFQEGLKRFFYCNYLYNIDEVGVIYIYDNQNKKNEAIIELLKYLFWDIRYDLDIFWMKHFGMIEDGNTGRLDEIVMY